MLKSLEVIIGLCVSQQLKEQTNEQESQRGISFVHTFFSAFITLEVCFPTWKKPRLFYNIYIG
jgi:hypothetical protein